MPRAFIAAIFLLLPACSSSSMPETPSSETADELLLRVFDPSERKTAGACFWDWLRDDVPAWNAFEYEWIASSCFGDQIVVTQTSPIHDGTAVYLLGPDISGPASDNSNWPENLLYLAPSVQDWLSRVNEFGDEHSIAPGDLDLRIDRADEYRRIYQKLNPGLTW